MVLDLEGPIIVKGDIYIYEYDNCNFLSCYYEIIILFVK